MYIPLRKETQAFVRGYAEFIFRGIFLTENAKIRLYAPTPLAEGKKIALGEEQSRYLKAVMRLAAGDEILLFDGKNGEFAATIENIGKKETLVAVNRQTRPFVPLPDIWLIFAPVKKDRTDFIIEKATELGATRIMPVITRRTIAGTVRCERFRAQAAEAAEQSRRLDVPQIAEPQKLEELLKKWSPSRKLFFMDESGGGQPARRIMAADGQPAALLIGPEGGFAAEEFAALRQCPFASAVSLGPLILRAETAVTAALSLWQAANGCWDGEKNAEKV